MFGKKSKAKSIDPNKIPMQVLVYEAELKTAEKKILQNQDNADRKFLNAIRTNDSSAAEEATKASYSSEIILAALPSIRSSLRELKDNTKDISSHTCAMADHEDAFRSVLIAGQHFKFEAGSKFWEIAKQLYNKDANILLDRTKLVAEVQKGFGNHDPNQEELKSTMRSICQRKNIDVSTVELVVGHSIAAQNIPTFEAVSNPTSFAPVQGGGRQHVQNDDIYVPTGANVFERSQWPQIIQAIKDATE